jgi:hypothetical protein
MAKGSSKGKNAAKCKTYKTEGRRERNKLRKLLKHSRKHSQDKVALASIANLRKIVPASTQKQDGTHG